MTNLVAKGLASSTVTSTGGVPIAASNNLPVQIVNLDQNVNGTTTFNDTQFPNVAFLRVNAGTFNKTGSAGMSALVNSTSLTPILIGSGTISGGLSSYSGNINAATVSGLGGLSGVTGTRTQTTSGQGATDFDGTATPSAEIGGVEWVRTTSFTGSTNFSTTITQGNSGFSGSQTGGSWNIIRENAAGGTGSWTARMIGSGTVSGTFRGKTGTVSVNGTTQVSNTPTDATDFNWSVNVSHGDTVVWTASAGVGGGGTINRSQSWSFSGLSGVAYTNNTNGGRSGSTGGANYAYRNDRTDGLTAVLNTNTRGISSETSLTPGSSTSTIVSGSLNESARIAGVFSWPSQAQFTSGTTRGVTASAVNERTVQRNQPNTTYSAVVPHNGGFSPVNGSVTGDQINIDLIGSRASNANVTRTFSVTFTESVTITPSGSFSQSGGVSISSQFLRFGGQDIVDGSNTGGAGNNSTFTIPAGSDLIGAGGVISFRSSSDPDNDNVNAQAGAVTIRRGSTIIYSSPAHSGNNNFTSSGLTTLTLQAGDVLSVSNGGNSPYGATLYGPAAIAAQTITLAAGTHTVQWRQASINDFNAGWNMDLTFSGGGIKTYATGSNLNSQTLGQTPVDTTVYDIRATNSNGFSIQTNSASTGNPAIIPANSNVDLASAVESQAWTIGWDTQRPGGTVLNAYSVTNNSGKRIFVGGVEIANGASMTIASGESATSRTVNFTQREDALSGDWNTDDFTGTFQND